MSQALDRIMSQDLTSWRTNGTQCLAPQATPRRTSQANHTSSNHSARHTAPRRNREAEATPTPTANAYAAPMWQDQLSISPLAFGNDATDMDFGSTDVDFDGIDDRFDMDFDGDYDYDDSFAAFENAFENSFDNGNGDNNAGKTLGYDTTDKVDINFDALYA